MLSIKIINQNKQKHERKSKPEKLSVAAKGSKTAETTFLAGDHLTITITGLVKLSVSAAKSPEQTENLSAIEYYPGMQISCLSETFGAPENKYLIFTNNDSNISGSVEIIRVRKKSGK